MDIVTTSSEVNRPDFVLGQPAIDPAIWTKEDLASSDDWLHLLSQQEIDGLVQMAGRYRENFGDDPNALLKTTKADFDLGPLSKTLNKVYSELKDGKGIALIRGLPMDDIELIDAAAIYWGMGRHMGETMSNNPEGDMLGHIRDEGLDYNDPNHRGYQTNVTMDYHCDQTDIVGLLCIQTARSGGLSKIVSSISVYNELLKRRPDLVEVMAQPYCWTKHAEMQSEEKNYYESPVFNALGGKLCVAFGPKHMEKGHMLTEAPDITDAQLEGIRLTEEICEELHYAMALERGDIQLANNCVALHTREGFEDWPEPERKRQLWRLWLVQPDLRPPTPYILQWRHGVHPAGTKLRVKLG
ncbi:MAG: TauD/TfdA family dioxygenase [Rhodospirillaceae bacterium]|nr:TauD/TfdA family dioxygenase [Rhodospirillaceae bacterium]